MKELLLAAVAVPPLAGTAHAEATEMTCAGKLVNKGGFYHLIKISKASDQWHRNCDAMIISRMLKTGLDDKGTKLFGCDVGYPCQIKGPVIKNDGDQAYWDGITDMDPPEWD